MGSISSSALVYIHGGGGGGGGCSAPTITLAANGIHVLPARLYKMHTHNLTERVTRVNVVIVQMPCLMR
jgi:hypothetical protein